MSSSVKPYKNVFPNSNTNKLNWLHITGLPNETTEEDISNLLNDYSVNSVKIFS